MFRITLAFAFLIPLTSSSTAVGGGRHSTLVSQRDARRLGLERTWFTRVAVDSAIGEISHVGQHISSTESYLVHQISYDGGKVTFSERDLNRLGRPIGTDALKLAERKRADLEAFGLNPKLNSHKVPLITLYVTTNRGVVHAIDAESGRTRWVAEVGKPGQAIEAPTANDQYVAVLNGLDVFVLGASDGKIVWQRKVRGAPGAGPLLSDQLLLVPMLTGQLESYQLDNFLSPPWVFQSTGRLLRPIYNGSVIAWPTDEGNLYVAQGNQNNLLYEVKTGQPMLASATPLHPGKLLAATAEGYVYCVDEEGGSIEWRFSTADEIRLSPVAVGNAVYVVTDNANLFRIRGEDGEDAWGHWTPGVSRFIAASEQYLYCVSDTGNLIVVDAKTGAKRGRLGSVMPDLPVPNKQTDRIFIGTRKGTLQCLREQRNEFPVIHLDLAETAAAPAEDQPPTEDTPTPVEDAPPVTVDPFGTPIGDAPGDAAPTTPENPFAPSTDTNPFGDSAPPPADPLGENPFE